MINIIVKDGTLPSHVKNICNDPIEADGIAPEEVLKRELFELEKDIMLKEYDELRKLKVKCDIVYNEKISKKTVVRGVYKNEIFVVYMNWIVNEKTMEHAGLLTTRFKGEDHEYRKPSEVLNVKRL